MKRDGLTITLEWGDTKQGCCQAFQPPPAPCLVCTGPQEEETVLRSISPRGWTLKRIRSEGAWESPTQSPILITSEEPQVLKTVGDQSVNFLLDTEATFSVLTEVPDPLCS